jgi:hypothetical protein
MLQPAIQVVLLLAFLPGGIPIAYAQSDNAQSLRDSMIEVSRSLPDLSVSSQSIVDAYQGLMEEAATEEQQAELYYRIYQIHIYPGRKNIEAAYDAVKTAEGLHVENLGLKFNILTQTATTVQQLNTGARGEDLARVRREAAPYYLRALKALIEQGVPIEPLELPPRPGLLTLLGDPEDPSYVKQIEEANRKVREFNAIDSLNRLISSRDMAESLLAHLYSRAPFDTAELAQLADSILEDQEAADHLLDQTRDLIGERLASRAETTGDEIAAETVGMVRTGRLPAGPAPISKAPVAQDRQVATQGPENVPDRREAPSRHIFLVLLGTALIGFAILGWSLRLKRS